MNLRVKRYGLEVESGNCWPDIDIAFVEEVLGLKNDGDYVRLVRKNANRLSCIAYLQTRTEEQWQSDMAWKERIKKENEERGLKQQPTTGLAVPVDKPPTTQMPNDKGL